MIITIDGPAGCGKSTIAKKLAALAGFSYFDTGAMYRAFTYHVLKSCKEDIEEKGIEKCLKDFSYHIEKEEGGEERYFVNKEEVTNPIRLDAVSKKVSLISTFPIVRHHLVAIQREYAKNNNAIFEGRDVGSVVFPDADIKFFLTADAKTRAKRRYDQLIEKFPEEKKSFSLSEILVEIEKRDQIDSTRKTSPLICPKDAFLIDTSDLSIDQVLEKMTHIIRKKKSKTFLKKFTPSFSKMKWIYRSVLFITWVYFRLFYKIRVFYKTPLPKGAAILASNHLSYFDPMAIPISVEEEIHFLARESLFAIPLIGWLIRKINAHPIKTKSADPKIFKIVLSLLKNGKKVLLFPEGTRSRSKELGPMEAGLGLITYKAQVPIIPIFLAGTFEAWPRDRKRPKIKGEITCHFGAPIFPEEYLRLEKKEAISHLMARLKKEILDLKKFSDSGYLLDLDATSKENP